MTMPPDVQSSGEPVIAVEGLTKRFGEKTVVDGFDMTVPKGAIYGFLGPNGSGKTTTIRMMCGLLTPDGGTGTCLGYDILTRAERADALKTLDRLIAAQAKIDRDFDAQLTEIAASE